MEFLNFEFRISATTGTEAYCYHTPEVKHRQRAEGVSVSSV
jgi:hypothetical protein